MVKVLLYSKRGKLIDTIKRAKFPTKIEIRSLDGESKVTYTFWKFIGGAYDKAGYKEI